MEYITKNTLRELLELAKKKHRVEQGRTFIEGARLLNEAIQSKIIIEEIFISESRLQKLKGVLPEELRGKTCTIVKDSDFNRIAETETPQGIGAVIRIPVVPPSVSEIQSNLVLYLDRVSDPGNLGTIFRTASWFGVQDVILSEDCAEAYNPKVIRSSMGAVFSEKIYRDPAGRAIKILAEKGYTIIAAHLEGEAVQRFHPKTEEKIVLIIGSEAHGVSSELLSLSAHKLLIPKLGIGESLNAAVSAGIFLAFLAKK